MNCKEEATFPLYFFTLTNTTFGPGGGGLEKIRETWSFKIDNGEKSVFLKKIASKNLTLPSTLGHQEEPQKKKKNSRAYHWS